MNKNKLIDLEVRIDEVLFFVWDPIEVSQMAGVRGEYSSYVKTILADVLDEDVKKIALHLDKIES